jgi:type IV pilus assembly protein PilP
MKLSAHEKMKNLKRITELFLIALIGFGLAFASLGCKGETRNKKEPVVTKKIASQTKAPAKKAALPSAKAGKNAAPTGQTAAPTAAVKQARLPYDPTGKLDPFRPLFKEEPKPKAATAQKPKKPERPRTPLEKLDLGQLRLTAVVFSEVRPRAMVEEDTGKGYVVEVGTPIGLERGQVTDIQRDHIVIEHLKADDFGNTSARRRELKLQKPPGD